MALKNWFKGLFSGTGQRVVAGSFIPNGTGAIATSYGAGFTVARTAVGTYRVTLVEPFADFVSVIVGGKFATNEASKHNLVEGDQSITGRWFDIVHQSSADVSGTNYAAADITASTTANKINFVCVVARSDVPGAGV